MNKKIVFFRISRMGFGGAERVFLSLAKSMLDGSEWSPEFVVDLPGGETFQVALNLGCKVHVLDASRTYKTLLKFRQLVQKIKPELVLAAYTDTNGAALLSLFGLRDRPRVFVSEHSSVDGHWSDRGFLRSVKVGLIVRWIYRLADRVICVSEGVASQVARRLIFCSDRVVAIHNPCRFSEVCLKSDVYLNNRGGTILAVGRVCFQKDYSTLIRAFRQVHERNSSMRLRIVGGTYDEGELYRIRKLVNELGLESLITFIDHTEDISSEYLAAKVLVLSSVSEGFGNVLVEALAHGLPVVSTDCDHGPREILDGGKFGLLVPVGDASALADGIEKQIRHPFPSKEMRLERAKDFSESAVLDRYLSLMDQ
jgi:glycosyltransferase involved in cell wall biosynthesis